MTSGRPERYRVQNGCHNCQYCDIDRPFDETFVYFCRQDGTSCPTEGRRRPFHPGWEEYWEQKHAWEEEHEVDDAGICDSWERNPEMTPNEIPTTEKEWYDKHIHTSDQFEAWWLRYYGRPEEYVIDDDSDEDSYWCRKAFAWHGWNAAKGTPNERKTVL